MNVLLTDSDSVIGSALLKQLENCAFVVLPPPPAELNWLDGAQVEAYFSQHRPDLFIDTSLFVGIDVEAPSIDPMEYRQRCEHLCRACGKTKTIPIYLSSYRVFGTAWIEGGCNEIAEPDPEDDFAQSLYHIERKYLSLDKAMVIRLSWLIDPCGDNLLTRILSHLKHGQAVALSDVIKGNPTSVDDVTRTLAACAQQIFCGATNWGVFHLHTSDACSEAEFADYLLRILERQEVNISAPLNVMTGAQTSALAVGSPLLKGKRLTNNFGIKLRTWRQGVKALVEEWLARAC